MTITPYDLQALDLENKRAEIALQNKREEHRRFWRFLIYFSYGLFITIAGLLGMPVYFRYQDRQEAANKVRVNQLIIQQTEQLVQVERQKAQIRTVEAEGIASAQKIINATLTDRYLQHEAIEAQLKMAGSPNHTQIYIPVGTNGIPLVKTVGE